LPGVKCKAPRKCLKFEMSLNKNELLLKSSTRTGTDELEVSAEYTKCVDR